MSFGLAVQKAIFDKLNVTSITDLVSGVLDAVDQDQAYPYITIGEDVLSEWDTNTTSGADGAITIHVWSRYKGKKEVKTIFAEIYSLLHNQSLTATGYDIVMCKWDTETSFLDSDGLTRHGVQTYRLLVDQT